jgi:hypothetical protein
VMKRAEAQSGGVPLPRHLAAADHKSPTVRGNNLPETLGT